VPRGSLYGACALSAWFSIDGKPAGTINKNENGVTFVADRLGLHHIRATPRG
jgi:hypothetical protein